MESVVKLDSKGRALVPIRLRKMMGIREGSELVLIPDKDVKGARILPLNNGKTSECRILMTDQPDGISSVMQLLDVMNISILMSESRNLLGNGASEWTFILDTSRLTEKPEIIEERLMKLDGVKSASIAGR